MASNISKPSINKLYGISNCDTVKKARKWLDKNQIAHEFVDFRKDGLSQKQVEVWLDDLGMATLVNRRSTTWKTLSDSDKELFTNNSSSNRKVTDLIAKNPTLIKRPVLESTDGTRRVGFKENDYQSLFS